MKKSIFKFLILPMIIFTMILFGLSSTIYADESYSIGDTGPAGGIIFYVDGSSYLEAAPSDQGFWDFTDNKILIGTTSTAIGTGQANTNAIIASSTTSAALVCDNYVLNGYTDWFLPSLFELELMYSNLHLSSLGGFDNNEWYWSSSEAFSTSAYAIYFGDGTQDNYDKDIPHSVRAIRAFTVKAEEPWVRTMPMTCWQVWINEDNDFQFIFWYPYKDENFVRIYDMEDNMVFETDLPWHDPNLIVDLPDGYYWVRTFDGLIPLQEFLIGKPGPEM